MLEMSTLSTGEVQEALQRVTADLEEANRELHDLREVYNFNLSLHNLFKLLTF